MDLGKLSYIEDLRTIWKHEEKEFTPWLADNMSILGEALGLDLEVISIEHDVGAFSLDILAKDTSSGNIVAIENQLETTDHSHLGQILTYASGVDAKTVIWISKEVREEHRKAIDWLNQITSEEMEFFAVEIQLIQIDQSSPAPFFKVKASPNDWSKEQKTKINSFTGITHRQEYFHKFFTDLMEILHEKIPGLTNSKRVSYDAWKSFPSSVPGCVLIISFRSGNRVSCELYIDSGNKDKNKARFDEFYSKKDEIEEILGELSWERLDDKKACRIAAYTDYTNDQEILAWAVQEMKSFRKCFKEFISVWK